jgi:hypothetical protein
VIARGATDIFTAVTAKDYPGASVRGWCEEWLGVAGSICVVAG